MRVIGKYLDRTYISHRVAQGGYVALDVQSAQVDTYNGKSIDECGECFIDIYSERFCYHVLTKEGNYFSSETANNIIKNLAISGIVDLDSYDMALFDAIDCRPEVIDVANEKDDEYNSIPLEVVIVNN